MKKIIKKMGQSGFTLVELMIVVAIIGILSAVAVPNFKRYMAKSKTTEAKIQLAAAYTAEQGFYGDFGMYSWCLTYMGFDPRKEINNRYFAVGFDSALTTDINATTHSNAVNNGLNGTDCGTADAAIAATAVAAATGAVQWFPAGKGNGSSISATETFLTNSSLGDQANTSNQTFDISAAGIVSADFTATGDMAKIRVDENKQYYIDQTGY